MLSPLLWLGIVVAANGVGVAAPESVPRGSVDAVVRGVGSITFVRLGSGEEGRDGGSWAGRGVSDIVVVVLSFGEDGLFGRGGEGAELA